MLIDWELFKRLVINHAKQCYLHKTESETGNIEMLNFLQLERIAQLRSGDQI